METVNAQKEQKNRKYKKVTQVEEENYIDSDSDDDSVDYNIDFGLKKQTSLKKHKSLKAKLSKAELKERFTFIFTDLLKEDYTQENLINDLKSLCDSENIKIILKAYFEYFHDGRIENCLPRLPIL